MVTEYLESFGNIVEMFYATWEACLTRRSHTTGEFHGSHIGSILPSQFQNTIVRKLSIRCGSKNYGTCFEHSRLRTRS